MKQIHVMVALLCLQSSAQAGVVEYDEDFQGWSDAVSGFTTITFTEVPFGILQGDEYASLGVHFVDGNDAVYPDDHFRDGAGVTGAGTGADNIELIFDFRQYWIGADFDGGLCIRLFLQGALIYDSTTFTAFDDAEFAGLISSGPFDEAHIRNPFGGVFVDNLYFGAPAPGAIGLLAAWSALGARPRRRS